MNELKKVARRITSTLAILVVMLGLIPQPFLGSVTIVFAQDDVTPVEEPVFVEETPTQESVSQPVEEVSADEAPVEDQLVEEGSTEEVLVEEIVADKALLEEIPVEEVLVEEVSVSEETVSIAQEDDLKEVVEKLAEAEIILADASGEPLSLTSNDTSDALIGADPYFTRGGDLYCYVPSGTTAHPSMGCDYEYDVPNPIQAAITDVETYGPPDDNTITVEPGTYSENVVINISGLTLYGDPGQEYEDGADSGAPILDGSSINGTGITIYGDSVSIIGFILRNYDIGISILDAGDVLIQDNTLEDNAVGIQVNNDSGTPGKVELYGNVIKSSEPLSIGLNVLAGEQNAIYGSLNSFKNTGFNVLDQSTRDDFELFFNEWGYFDGSSYVKCSITGHTDADYAGLFDCAKTEGVLPQEMLLDGSLLPYVFSQQDVNQKGQFCLDEKNYDYATRTESGGGPLSLSYGESLSVVAVKQATSCYYQLAPVVDDEPVYLDVNGVNQCIQVTRSTNPSGEFSYLFEVLKPEEPGCGLSHVVGYFDPLIEEEPECQDKSCEEVFGCTDITAINYDALATTDDSTCEFITEEPPTTSTPTDPGTPPTLVTFIENLFIPVTGNENLLIPVTGADLGLQTLIPFGGTLLLGVSFLVKGIYGKIKK